MLTPEQAAASPFLHSITHWVGPDAPARPPRLATLTPDRPGRLVLCTDGLWNYVPSAAELASSSTRCPTARRRLPWRGRSPTPPCERGGHDNITVAVVDIDPSTEERER